MSAASEHTSREVAAFHEAGHAVIAVVVGADLKRVTILARKRRVCGAVMQTCGLTEAVLPFDISEVKRRDLDALFTLAGALAEERYRGRRATGETIHREEYYVLRLGVEAVDRATCLPDRDALRNGGGVVVGEVHVLLFCRSGLTGDFCTSREERLEDRKEPENAEEDVYARADCFQAATD